MIKEIKRELLSNPQAIVNILEFYDFYKVHIQNDEIRCGLYEGSNPTAIRIKLINNDNLFVKDYARNFSYDLITYLIRIRNADFADIMKVVKTELGIIDFYSINTKRSIFGGFYERIKNKTAGLFVKTYPKTILNDFHDVYNKRFYDDKITFETQERFNIGYDPISQRITIPIYNAYGELIGVKARATWEVEDNESKYYYVIPCAMSSTLYGYCQNYDNLTENDIFVFESEKSVLQCHSYGIHNCVALGCNSISTNQCKLLMELNPKRIIFMLDKGLKIENTMANIKTLKTFTRMFSTTIWWWDWRNDDFFDDKDSPTDKGKSALEQVIREELVEID